MAIVQIIAGVVTAAAVYGFALVEFPDEIQTYAPNLIPGKLAPLLPPPLPHVEAPRAAFWLDQNWREQDRRWAHHASQGTATLPVPYAWFVALEQPYIWLVGQPGLLGDGAYMQRLGFIPSPRADAPPEQMRAFGFGWSKAPEPPPISPSTSLKWLPAANDDGLPVGFARLKGAVNPATGQPDPKLDLIGLTCAACHTGHVDYKGVSLRVDGGPALVDLQKLSSVLGLSIGYTLLVPSRFDRFADRVLGPGATQAERKALKEQFEARFARIREKGADEERLRGIEAGAGRLDAINRIGNQVFYYDLEQATLTDHRGNSHPNDAPVSFPPIWNAPWFLWAQYDGTIEQPLIRNAGEALGVMAPVDLSSGKDAPSLYRSSILFANLLWIEDLLRGPDPFAGSSPKKSFGGLAAPKWPAALFPDDPAWRIDADKVRRGRVLYAELCAGCHLGPIDDADFDGAYPQKQFWSSQHWRAETGEGGVRGMGLDLPRLTVADVGTDPARAKALATREVETPAALGINVKRDIDERWGCGDGLAANETTRMLFAAALMVVVDNSVRKWMDENNLPASERAKVWGARKSCINEGGEYYRTRPLNGVWATAPYLHNGSVASLDWLLRPAAERPTQFCVGASDFDPRTVGFPAKPGDDARCAVGETRFSARDDAGRPIPGNDPGGHSFENNRGPGVVGRALDDGERADLIDYLKTL